ncbi:MAG: hypothetical protein ABIS35_06690 [Terracoccus sp.]
MRRVTGRAAPPPENPAFRGTYGYLRAAVVVLVVMLAAAVLLDTLQIGGLRGSISAYYYGSSQTIFTGVLAGIGIAMLAYQGNTESEDHLLDFSGTMAFFVATIPTPSDTKVPLEVISTGVRAVILAFVLALCANWYLSRRFPFPKEPLARVGAIAVGLWLVGYGVLVLVDPELLAAIGHPLAAIPMFVAIVLVAAINAFSTKGSSYSGWYVGVAAAIPAGLLAVAITVWRGSSTGVFWAEVVVLAAFAVFWVVQTVELTTQPARTT